MLVARHSLFHKRVLFAYVGWRLRRGFHSIALHGAESLEQPGTPFPLVLYSNHETWWDGFFEIPIFRRYGLDYYIMMEEANLRRFKFFSHCGVFGVDLTSRQGRAAGLLHAVRLLRAEGAARRTLVVYPHGRLTPASCGPIAPFQAGLGKLLELAPDTTAIPVFKWIRFRKHPLPEVFIALGEPLFAGKDRCDDALRGALEATRERLFGAVRAVDEGGGSVPGSWGSPHWIVAPPRHYRGKTD